MIDYALRLTRCPQDVERADVERLRAAGLTDAEIHRVTAVVGYFNFVNRIAEGLGVSLEEPSHG